MSNVIDLENWKLKTKYFNLIKSVGIEINNEAAREIKNPAVYYLFEPIKNQFIAASIFDKDTLVKFVNEGTSQFGTKEEIYNISSAFLVEYLSGKVPETEKSEFLNITFISNLINFAASQTAKLTVNDTSNNFRHFGTIFIDNPHRGKDVVGTMRPMAMVSEDLFVPRHELAVTVSEYLVKEFSLHPEYFTGYEIKEVVGKLLHSSGSK